MHGAAARRAGICRSRRKRDAALFPGAARVPAGLAVGWEKGAKEPWIVATDGAADAATLRDYGLRFCVEEGFLDHKSGGFQWESSRMRGRGALQRLCRVMAAATLFLVCQGAAAVAAGRRREVEPHWSRGLSYARVGWNWGRRVLVRGGELVNKN